MGKPFESEMLAIPQTIRFAEQLNLDRLPSRVSAACSGPVILVGSGGSFSAAEFAQKLFDNKGAVCQSVSALAFLQSAADLRGASVFIFTAGGNNKDVLAAFSAARTREARSVTVVCASSGSKVEKMASDCDRAYVFSFRLPTRKDGYLATNSLIATFIVLSRAFKEKTIDATEAMKWIGLGRSGFSQAPPGHTHCLILYSGWSRAAAVDLESKLSEAGLASSMLADFRHFAHGRHNWIDKQRPNSRMLVFSDSTDQELADATVRLLPRALPVWRCRTKQSGSVTTLQFLLAVFGFVAANGRASGIDPGRPGVPAYGSKLYHLGPLGISVRRSTRTLDLCAAAERKRLVNRLDEESAEMVRRKGQEFVRRLTEAEFGALVTDFDGTLLPVSQRGGPLPDPTRKVLQSLLLAGIPVIFATGRGDSIQKTLAEAFPQKRLWDHIYIGYFNGAFTLPLSRMREFKDRTADNAVLGPLEQRLRADPGLGAQVRIKNKGWQLTLEPTAWDHVDSIAARLQTHLVRLADKNLRLVSSSHSVDILPLGVSKSNCRVFAETIIKPQLKLLAIGDCGAYPGNDFDLLSSPFSLSVDSVSADLESCWNLLPWGISHAAGGKLYLEHFSIRSGVFTFTD